MSMLLISEGNHEGSSQPELPQSLLTLVNKVLQKSPQDFHWRTVRDLPVVRGKGKGCVLVGQRALHEAKTGGYEAVILVVDNDRCDERLEQMKAVQEQTTKYTTPRAFGIAVETYDAWMLADHQALGRVLNAYVPLLPLPENYQGRNDTPDHPKEVCRKLMKDHQWQGNQPAFYQAVAQAADIEVLANRCPKGFKPFLDRLRQLATQLHRPAGSRSSGPE